MTKVLYIGNYKDGTGWSHAAIDYISALDFVGIDVVPRAIKLNNINVEYPERIKELEKKSTENCDVVIQHVLPHLMTYDSRFRKNIGLFVNETDNYIDMGWSSYLNTMDELWVPNFSMIDSAKKSGVSTHMEYIPHACDINKYTKSYYKLNIPELHGDFVFYWIGEFTNRKNLLALLKAFHSEFHSNEPVSLLIKTFVSGLNDRDAHNRVSEFCNRLKQSLKLYKNIEDYHNEIIITQRLSEEQICSLHQTGDCHICSSSGEAWSIPTFDAMGFSKPIIANNIAGINEFVINNRTGLLVDNHPTIVNDVLDSFPDLFTANEIWKSIDILHLRTLMRRIYEDIELRNKLSSNCMDKVKEFSYQKVGLMMKELLND